MSTGSVFCSHRLGVVGAHDHLLVILYLIFPNSHTAFCEGPMRAIHISWERIQLCLSSLALFMNSECRTLHEGALMGKRAFGLVRAKLFHLCLTLCNPMDCSPPGSSVHGTLQARMLEWAAISYSRGSSWCRDRTSVAYVSCTGRQVFFLPLAPPRKSLWLGKCLQLRGEGNSITAYLRKTLYQQQNCNYVKWGMF